MPDSWPDLQHPYAKCIAPNHYCVGYANPDASYPPPVEGGGSNVDGYGRTLVHMGVGSAGDWIIPYISSNGEVSSVAFGGATTSNAGGVVHCSSKVASIAKGEHASLMKFSSEAFHKLLLPTQCSAFVKCTVPLMLWKL
ncbi:hypothetical protein POTOM_056298 [Populus tomentosa]|uniref:Uncharacterized protein n=1 Tax=Populus tomentosa TaxID=118781 RepID=A0A8X8C5Z9_POPTO|nr:hypothetical protein POTOM_056298 [Populus tomentosa]